MKINKKGQVKLDPNEIRIGNFFIKRDSDQMKITDLNGVFHHSVSRRMPIGIWLEQVWARAYHGEEGPTNTLKVYIATMWSLFSIAPDDEFIQAMLNASNDALKRHPDWYGYKPSDDEAENAEAAQEVKEMTELEQSLKESPDAQDASPSE